VFKSKLEVWQIPSTVYSLTAVSYAELYEKVYPHGELGRYLVDQLVEFNSHIKVAREYRCLGDSPAVGVMMYMNCGKWQWRPAPEFDQSMHYKHTGLNRPIRVYDTVDTRFLFEDFFAKLAQFTRSQAK
jgi:hypothetical protein